MFYIFSNNLNIKIKLTYCKNIKSSIDFIIFAFNFQLFLYFIFKHYYTKYSNLVKQINV